MEAAGEEASDTDDAIEDPEEPEDSPAQDVEAPADDSASPPARMPDFRRALQQRRYVPAWYTCPRLLLLPGACTAMLITTLMQAGPVHVRGSGRLPHTFRCSHL